MAIPGSPASSGSCMQIHLHLHLPLAQLERFYYYRMIWTSARSYKGNTCCICLLLHPLISQLQLPSSSHSLSSLPPCQLSANQGLLGLWRATGMCMYNYVWMCGCACTRTHECLVCACVYSVPFPNRSTFCATNLIIVGKGSVISRLHRKTPTN